METPDFNGMAKKWQAAWKQANAFATKDDSPKPKYYCLEMYPYPSGSSLHMGHVRNYTIGDAHARFMRMQGRNILYPMGYDAFGLPAENAAKKEHIHPREYTKKAIAAMRAQLEGLGLSYDWSRTLASCDEDYYRWNQWFFLKMMEAGLAYRKKAPINWCPSCATVLANEQVEEGKCWRCDSVVEIKPLEQWFLKITAYADRLLEDLDKLPGWPERILTMQRNWIGKSTGTEVEFRIEGSDKTLPIFTTRVDTIYGVTFMVMAPEHPWVEELTKGTEYEEPAKAFARKVVMEDKFARTAEETEKEGLFIGRYAINPLTHDRVPIYVGNFVLLEYGAGAVMAVPAHDQRDFAFAKRYDIPIKVVIQPDGFRIDAAKMSRAYTEDGTLDESGPFTNLPNRLAIEDLQVHLEKHHLGKKTVQYKLRDWLISRQRYWGTPIPVVYCEHCGMQPLKEADLPVRLPDDITFEGQGNPLSSSKSFAHAPCSTCGKPAKRETDTMDGFMDSCWYFLGYTQKDRSKVPFERKTVDQWMPVDQYIGGSEHAVMHLLYARFFTKVLKDFNLVGFDEPFTKLFNQGIVYKDGAKMSKSKGNVVTQAAIAERFGIDTARWFLMSLAAPDKTVEWDDDGIMGAYRALRRIHTLSEKPLTKEHDPLLASRTHRTIKSYTTSLEEFRYNTALVELMELVRLMERRDALNQECYEALLKLLLPFVPHLTEELWERSGHTTLLSLESWPQADESRIDLRAEAAAEVEGALVQDVRTVLELAKIEKPHAITVILASTWKYAFVERFKTLSQETRDPGTLLKSLLADPVLKQHGQDIAKMVPAIVKDPSKLPQTMLSADEELAAVIEATHVLETAFGCPFKVEHAESSTDPKAKVAFPGRPGISVR